MLVSCSECKRPLFISSASVEEGPVYRRCDECNAELIVESSGAVRLQVPEPTFGGVVAALEDPGPTTGDFGALSEEVASSEPLDEVVAALEEGPEQGASESTVVGASPLVPEFLDEGDGSGVPGVWLALGLVVALVVTSNSERLFKGLRSAEDWVERWSSKVLEGDEGARDPASAVEAAEAGVESDDPDGERPESFSEQAMGHYLQGNRYLKEEKVSRALLEYRAALMLEPEFGLAYRALGITNNLMGRRASAAAAYQRFVELEPSHPGVDQAQAFIRTHSSK